MELHERLNTVDGRAARRATTRSRSSRAASTSPSSATSGRSSSTSSMDPEDAARAGARRHPRPARAGDGPLARRPRADRARGRRRHPRPRPARAAARRRHRDARSWSTARTTSGSSATGRLYQTDVRFNDESHLRRIINKIVAQVGRRIDESSPMVDARLPDGSRVNAIIPPLSLSGPLITIRKFSRNRLTLDDMIKLGTLSPETVEFLERCVHAAAEHPHLRRHRLRQDDAAQRALDGDPGRRSGSSRSRTPPSCGSTSGTCCGSSRARRTSRARARSRSATSCATRCACGPTGSSSARFAAPRRSTCSRR